MSGKPIETGKRVFTPCRVAVDSQSIKQSEGFSHQVGVDGNKKIEGRKRHLDYRQFGFAVG